MRDRNFITWLVGLISTPLLLQFVPVGTMEMLNAIPLLLGVAALLALFVVVIYNSYEHWRQHSHEEVWAKIPHRRIVQR